MRNTIEQYAGLEFVAASPFFEKTFSISRKSRNRTFSQNEQYAGLESGNRPYWPIQAARSRGCEHPWIPWIQGYQGCSPDAESHKVAILATLLVSGKTDPRGRLGPPESARKPEKTRKHGKHGKTRFLRVTRASTRGCHIEAIVATSGSPRASPRWPSVLLRDPTPVGSRNRQEARSLLPPLGRLRLPRPLPIVGPFGSSSTGCGRCQAVCCTRRDCGSRTLAS